MIADDHHPRIASVKPATIFWLHILHVFIEPYHVVNEPELAEIDNTSTQRCGPNSDRTHTPDDENHTKGRNHTEQIRQYSMTRTQQEILKQGYQALVDSLGVIDAIRFLQYFSPGQGDYTKERHQWLDKKSLEDIFAEMKQRREGDRNQYDEIIE
jgi:hypothetical protein